VTSQSCLLSLLATSSSVLTPAFFSFTCSRANRGLHSFPTRRSSDLRRMGFGRFFDENDIRRRRPYDVLSLVQQEHVVRSPPSDVDRKSTRLNSSHRTISYAVFCLKKKKTQNLLKTC